MYPRVLFVCLLFSIGVSTSWGQSPAAPKFSAKSAHEPTPIPDRIILTWAGDPANSQSVTWRTSTTVRIGVGQIALCEPGPGFDSLGTKSSVPSAKIRQFPATTTSLKTDLNEAHFHSLTFDALTPKTQYVYRVGDGVHWSEWFQFETASEKPEPFGFIYFGDAQNDLKRHWSRVVRGAYSDMPKAKFIIHAGDLVNSGGSDAEWGEWFQAAGWINGMVPSVPTPGNHEYSGGKPKSGSGLTAHWRKQFALPEHGPIGLEESAFTMDYQGVRFVSLNSNERIAEQIPWMEKVLSNNPNRWTILTFHHPIYSTAKGRDNKALREKWRPVFERYPIDLILQGHDHTYGRSGLMHEDNLLTGANAHPGTGTVYVVSVSGPKMYSVESREWMVSKAQNIQLYQLIHVNGDRLHYEARTATGELYDEFELRKRSDGNDLIERASLQAERTNTEPPSQSGRNITYALGGMALLGIGYGFVRKAWRRVVR